VLFVNGFRRATSPPVTIASITNNPVRQGRLGLVRCFLRTITNNSVFIFNPFFVLYFLIYFGRFLIPLPVSGGGFFCYIFELLLGTLPLNMYSL